MSSYKNFVSDFPARCAALLEDFERTARLRKREVTLMLCVAMPSIVVPLERLAGPRPTPKGESPGHPSRDWERFEQAKSALEDLFELPFRGSPLWRDTAPSSWFFGELSDVSNGPDSWDELGTVVELRRVVRGWHNQAIASATVNVRFRPTGAADRFEVVRRFNGQAADEHQSVDRQAAYQLVSSFRLPLFDVRQVDPDGTYEVTIKAMLTGGRDGPLTTKVLARAELLR